MARRQNIERRRKQIRHYQARRRRRSPVWRALLFWWAPALVFAMAGAALLLAIVGFSLFRPGVGAPGRYVLPQAGLHLVHATAAQVGEVLRMGNARRLLGALSDADIGISLKLPLPEPRAMAFAPLDPLPPIDTRRHSPARTLPLPLAWEWKTDVARHDNHFEVRIADALEKAGFSATPKPPPGRGKAVFWVGLDGKGCAETVLRLAPSGVETAPLRALRTALLAGRGQGAAQGTVTVIWDTAKESP